MRRHENTWHRIVKKTESVGYPLPGVPLVELAGDGRVLIENHHGVTELTKQMVCVRVKYGSVIICGNALEISFMSKQLMIIKGQIDMIRVERS